MFGPRLLCQLCSEAKVTRDTSRSLQRILSEFTGPTSPESMLTAHFNPKWTVVVDACVAPCDLQIGGTNIASTTGNNVGTSSSFKEILAPG